MSIAIAPPVDALADLSDVAADTLADNRILTWEGTTLQGASRMSWDNSARILTLQGPSYPLRLRYNKGQAGWAIDAPGTDAYGNADMAAIALTGTLNVSGGITSGNFVRIDSSGSGLIDNATWSYSVIGPAFVAKGTALNNVFGGMVNDGRFWIKDGLQVRNTLTTKPTLEVQTASGQTEPSLIVKDSAGVAIAAISSSGLQMYNTSGTATTLIGRASTLSGGLTVSGNTIFNNEVRVNGPFVTKGTVSFDNALNSYDTTLRLRPISAGTPTSGQTAACDVTSSVASLPQFRVQGASGQSVSTFEVTANTATTKHLSVLADGKTVAHVGLGVGNSASATTLGSVTKKMEVFDASGNSLGFVPIYDSIT
jgi:hypothetical protein